MKGFGVVYRKELMDAARDRRAMLSALLALPLGMPLFFGGAIFLVVEDRMEDATTTLSVPMVGARAVPRLLAQLEADGIEADHDTYADRAGLEAAVRGGEAEVGLVVADDFGAALQSGTPARVWVLFDSSRTTSALPTMRLKSAIGDYSRTIGMGRLQLRGVHPAIAAPIALLDEDFSTPQSRSIIVFGMMTYFLIFATFFGGSQVALDATVGERERGSLEPLLAMPVWPRALVVGKVLAAATFMVTALALSVVTFSVASRWLPLAKLGMAASLAPATAAGLWLVVAPFAPLAAGVVTLAASFAKTLKEAWTYNSVAMLVPTLPIIYFSLKPLQASWPLMLVPSLSQHLLVTALVKGEDVAVGYVLTSLASTTAIAALLAWAATTRYRRGRLLA